MLCDMLRGYHAGQIVCQKVFVKIVCQKVFPKIKLVDRISKPLASRSKGPSSEIKKIHLLEGAVLKRFSDLFLLCAI
jgi:hypothetical protein